MPRLTWSRILLFVCALPLGSCFTDEPACPTCPPQNSGRIDFFARPLRLQDNSGNDTLRLNYALVSVDGGDPETAFSGESLTFEGLRPGTHTVTIVRWFTHNELPESRLSNLRIELARGETISIVFHDNFPLISWSPPPAGRDGAPGPGEMAIHRTG